MVKSNTPSMQKQHWSRLYLYRETNYVELQPLVEFDWQKHNQKLFSYFMNHLSKSTYSLVSLQVQRRYRRMGSRQGPHQDGSPGIIRL